MLTDSQARQIVGGIAWPDGEKPSVSIVNAEHGSAARVVRGGICAEVVGPSPERCLSMALATYIERANVSVTLPQLAN